MRHVIENGRPWAGSIEPAERTLAALIASNTPGVAGRVRDVARLMAAFHRGSPAVCTDLPATLYTPPPALFQANLRQTEELAAPGLSALHLCTIRALAARYAAGRSALFAERLAAGLIREGHGDLLCSDVFLLDDGPRILDGLEFDERRRVGDVLLDVASLAMDLGHLNRPDLARLFVETYAAAAGASYPQTLLDYYIAHRALVRAKVAAISATQGRPAAADAAASLVERCIDHLRLAQVRILLLGGLPGTGKTTVAAELAQRWPAVHLSSDVVRREIVPRKEHASYRSGHYAPAATDAVYDELLRRAQRAVRSGHHVVLDASWSSEAQRRQARRLAAEVAAELLEVELRVDDGIAEARLRSPARTKTAAEAEATVRAAMRRNVDPWPEAAPIDAGTPVGVIVNEITKRIQRPVRDLGPDDAWPGTTPVDDERLLRPGTQQAPSTPERAERLPLVLEGAPVD